jgi:hypothetical protein
LVADSTGGYSQRQRTHAMLTGTADHLGGRHGSVDRAVDRSD